MPALQIAPVLTITLNPAIDLHFDLPEVPRGGVVRAAAARRSAGGKGVNVSRVLRTLGIASECFCLAPPGPDTEVYRSLFRSSGILPLIFSIQPAIPLRTNITIAVVHGGRNLKINQPGPPLTASGWRRAEAAIAALLPGRRWLVLSGALPPGAPIDAYARLTRRAHRLGVAVALDCAGPPLLAALAEHPELVKPNLTELKETLARPCCTRAERVRAARELQALGASEVIVSAGAAQCLAFSSEEGFRVQPPKIQATGAMGAGDSLLAGFLAGKLRGKSFADSLRLGIAAAAATAARPTTLFCQAGDIKKLMDQVSFQGLV